VFDEAEIRNPVYDSDGGDDGSGTLSTIYVFRGELTFRERVHSSRLRRMLRWKDSSDWGDLLLIPCVPEQSSFGRESKEVLWRRTVDNPDENDEMLEYRPLVESTLDNLS
jgi:hypothetical protein